ncbi:MAG: lytic transglycosylase domain-containing protein [Acidobacteria bacterium]|nr:lytic transglycosylase domain-containing protein [Acidobacteriota bacterium]
MNFRRTLVVSSCCFAFAGIASPVSAEIVFLTSNRTLSIKSHRIDGDSIVLTLRGGGEVTCDKSLIEKIVPDEVPYVEPKGDVTSVESQSAAVQSVDPAVLEQTPYGEVIAAVSEAHGVNPLLVRALIQVESNYRPKARSNRGAMGLMQLMPATAREYKVGNPYDPKANIAAGVRHLKGLIDRWGVTVALAAYNAGEGAVKKFNGIPPYRETRNYVAKIMSLAGGQ